MILRLLLTCLIIVPAALAQQDEPADTHVPASSSTTIPLSDYNQQLARMQALVAACRAQADQCSPAAVPADAQVQSATTLFQQRWDWLRIAIEKSRNPKEPERLTLLDAVAERIASDSLLAAGQQHIPSQQQLQQQARTRADSILNQAEFRRVQRAGYLQRKLAAFWLFIDRLFSGAAGLIPQSAWFATLLEWGMLAAALAGLILWAWSLNRQQRLIIIAHTDHALAGLQKESEDWASRARAEAALGQWREAVHSLYWSAIVLLEGRKLWRQNRARTPREYLPLLEAGSERRAALTGLTRVFERIWYGLRPASAEDYAQSEALLERLRNT